MISRELRARIRRLFYAEHWKVGTIATELRVHHDTVERALGALGRAGTAPLRPMGLDPYKPFIVQTLEHHPRLRATRVHEMVKARGFERGIAQVRRYMRMARPGRGRRRTCACRRCRGRKAQVDWGDFGKLRVGNALRPLCCFVLVLSYSRAIWAHFSLEQTLEPFLRGHLYGFEWLGGVPRALLYDNLKTRRAGAAGGPHPLPSHAAGAGGPLPLRPQARARPTGETRRGRSSAPSATCATPSSTARTFASVDDLNAQLATWLLRRSPTRAGCPRTPEGRRSPRRSPRRAPPPAPAAQHPLRDAISCGRPRRARRPTSASTSTTTPSRTPS